MITKKILEILKDQIEDIIYAELSDDHLDDFDTGRWKAFGEVVKMIEMFIEINSVYLDLIKGGCQNE